MDVSKVLSQLDELFLKHDIIGKAVSLDIRFCKYHEEEEFLLLTNIDEMKGRPKMSHIIYIDLQKI